MFMRDILYVDVVIFVIIVFGLIQKSPKLCTLRDFLSGRRFIIKGDLDFETFTGMVHEKREGYSTPPLKTAN